LLTAITFQAVVYHRLLTSTKLYWFVIEARASTTFTVKCKGRKSNRRLLDREFVARLALNHRANT